jgi:autotransporter-associated beta strand protein
MKTNSHVKTTLRDVITRSFLPGLCIFAAVQACEAGSATWRLNPANGNWNQAANWTPKIVPNGSSDIATFSTTDQPSIALWATVEISEMDFTSDASQFTINVRAPFFLTLSGPGVVNSSAQTQSFVLSGHSSGGNAILDFTNFATAGTQTDFTLASSTIDGGAGSYIEFFNNSSAGSGSFSVQGSRFSGGGSLVDFLDASSAANASFTVYGGLRNQSSNGYIQFMGSSTADHGTFVTTGNQVEDSPPGIIYFGEAATAGNGVFMNLSSPVSNGAGGYTWFFGNSTAANGTFNISGGATLGAIGGEVAFFENSTGESSDITADGGSVSGARASDIAFYGNSTAASATLTAKAATAAGAAEGGIVAFAGTSSASSATIAAEDGAPLGAPGGSIFLYEDSTGGTARLKLFGNARLDVSLHNPLFVSAGSIEGSGSVFLGGMFLEVGFNNLSTTFSGIIQDGGLVGGVGGTLFKEGTGTLTLSGANIYTGGTAVDDGVLLLTNKSGSATGTGDLSVNQGTLGGTGKVAGSISLGTGAGSGAFLAPGVIGAGTLTTQRMLSFGGISTYLFEVDTKRKRSDSVSARGVTILSDTTFSLIAIGNRPIPAGTVFTAIRNNSHAPIGGTFSNLADGSTITDGSNTYKASYAGGDGNDLTLTVQ